MTSTVVGLVTAFVATTEKSNICTMTISMIVSLELKYQVPWA